MAKKQNKVASLERILFIGDVHIPYHDTLAWKLLIAAARQFKPHHIIITGDFVDFYSVSSHSKDPRRALSLETEISQALDCLGQLRSLGARTHTYISGNHEDRLERYLRDRAPELYSVVSIPAILQLDRHNFAYVPYKQHHQIGRLYVTHDVGSSGKNAIFNASAAFQRNIVTGHTHRTAYIIEGAADGKTHVSASFGHLLDIEQVDYMHQIKAKRDWTLGFGIGYLNPSNGFVYLTPVPIVEYTCQIEGKLLSIDQTPKNR